MMHITLSCNLNRQTRRFLQCKRFKKRNQANSTHLTQMSQTTNRAVICQAKWEKSHKMTSSCHPSLDRAKCDKKVSTSSICHAIDQNKNQWPQCRQHSLWTNLLRRKHRTLDSTQEFSWEICPLSRSLVQKPSNSLQQEEKIRLLLQKSLRLLEFYLYRSRKALRTLAIRC